MPFANPERTALIVVDMQPDFMPGGALACHEGDTIVPGIARLLRARRYRHVVATQDWHPAGHISFASSHRDAQAFQSMDLHGHLHTLWPDHCVQGTPGAALHAGVDWSVADLILRKGSDPRVDSYSTFRENHGPRGTRPATGLAGWLRERGVEAVLLCGLARDICVLWSAQDALAEGFKVGVLWDLTRPVTPASNEATRTALAAQDIAVVPLDD